MPCFAAAVEAVFSLDAGLVKRAWVPAHFRMHANACMRGRNDARDRGAAVLPEARNGEATSALPGTQWRDGVLSRLKNALSWRKAKEPSPHAHTAHHPPRRLQLRTAQPHRRG